MPKKCLTRPTLLETRFINSCRRRRSRRMAIGGSRCRSPTSLAETGRKKTGLTVGVTALETMQVLLRYPEREHFAIYDLPVVFVENLAGLFKFE